MSLSYEDRRQPSALEESTFTERALLERIALCRRELNRSSDELKLSPSLSKVRAHQSPYSRGAGASAYSGNVSKPTALKGSEPLLLVKSKVESAETTGRTRSSSISASTDHNPSSNGRIESAKARLEKAKEAQAALLMKSKPSGSVDSDSEKSVASTIKRAAAVHRTSKQPMHSVPQRPAGLSPSSKDGQTLVPQHMHSPFMIPLQPHTNLHHGDGNSALHSVEWSSQYTFRTAPDLLDPDQFTRYLYSNIPNPPLNKPATHARPDPESIGNSCNILVSYNQIASLLNGVKVPPGTL